MEKFSSRTVIIDTEYGRLNFGFHLDLPWLKNHLVVSEFANMVSHSLKISQKKYFKWHYISQHISNCMSRSTFGYAIACFPIPFVRISGVDTGKKMNILKIPRFLDFIQCFPDFSLTKFFKVRKYERCGSLNPHLDIVDKNICFMA